MRECTNPPRRDKLRSSRLPGASAASGYRSSMRTALFTVSFAGLWGQDRLTLEARSTLPPTSVRRRRDHGKAAPPVSARLHRGRLPPSSRAHRRARPSRGGCSRLHRLRRRHRAIEVPFVEMQIAHVTDLAARAAALGCDSFASSPRTSTGRQASCRPAHHCRGAPKLLRSRRAHGVRIGVQNHHDVGVDTAAYLELLAEVDRPNIVPMFDCWSPFLRGEDVVAAAAALAARMPFTTVADYRLFDGGSICRRRELRGARASGSPRCSDGTGRSPVRSFLQALQAKGSPDG